MELYIDNRVGGRPRYFLAPNTPRLSVVPDEVLKSVVFLCCRRAMADAPRPGGTAFLLSDVDSASGTGFLYLVTAKHNLDQVEKKGCDGMVHIRANFTDGAFRNIETKASDWVSHSDPTVDAAVLPIDGWPEEIECVPFPLAGLMDERKASEQILLGPADTILIAGLFTSRPGNGRNIPIIRTGTIAAMPDEPVLTTWTSPRSMKAYLAEVRSIGGLSGSPVFAAPEGMSRKRGALRIGDDPHEHRFLATVARDAKLYLIGLVHGHWSEKPDSTTDSDATNDDLWEGETVNAGIAIIVPCSKITEILELAPIAEWRARKIAETQRVRSETVADQGEFSGDERSEVVILRRTVYPTGTTYSLPIPWKSGAKVFYVAGKTGEEDARDVNRSALIRIESSAAFDGVDFQGSAQKFWQGGVCGDDDKASLPTMSWRPDLSEEWGLKFVRMALVLTEPLSVEFTGAFR